MEPYPKLFGARLRKLLDERGKSIVQFAREFPLSEANVHLWLKKEDPPLRKYWSRLAAYFGCDQDLVVYGKIPEPLPPEPYVKATDLPGEIPLAILAKISRAQSFPQELRVLPSADDLRAECRAVAEKLIAVAGSECERLAWVREQMGAINPPRHWIKDDRWAASNQKMFDDMRRDSSARVEPHEKPQAG